MPKRLCKWWNTNDGEDDDEYDNNDEDDDEDDEYDNHDEMMIKKKEEEEEKKIYTHSISPYHFMLLPLASGTPYQKSRWQRSPNSTVL